MKSLNYRVIVLALCVFVASVVISASAQTYTELLSFNGTSAAGPEGPLTQGIDGSLYGTTFFGGTGACNGEGGVGCGVVFKVGTNRKLQILHNFQPDSPYPENGLVLGEDGNFYGTTTQYTAYGTIFKITPVGDFTVLYSFNNAANGYYPQSLIQAADGDLYGTTYDGGTPSNSCPSGCGTVFKMTPAGKLTTLYSFCPQNYCSDGENPRGALAQGADGNFYGTTTNGGVYRAGTFFKITPKGEFTLLYTFDNAYAAAGGLILASDGNFYGTAIDFYLFQLTPQGKYAEWQFGADHSNAPIQGSDGNIYWTDQEGGIDGLGVVFELPLGGQTISTIYSFAGYPNDGAYPEASLVQATDGKFYGTTFTGGPYPCNYSNPGCGTIFSIDMGLQPFVAFVNRAGRVGKQVGILGQNFAGTTSVSINGTPASFTVKSNTLLIATVPAGATTGYVTVTTPSGVLTSNVSFYVVP